MSARRFLPAALIAAHVAVPCLAGAQDSSSARQGPRVITPADIKAWNSIRQTALSNDGAWFAHVVSPNEGNATLVVRRTAQGATETRIPVGENGGSIEISGDSRWLGYLVAPDWVDTAAARGRGAGRGGRAGGAAGAQAADSARPPRVPRAPRPTPSS